MPSFRVIIAVMIMSFVLSSCGNATITANPTDVPADTPQITSTPVKTATPTRNAKWATYQNSFEDLSSATASGFAANPPSLSSLKINGDLAATGKQSLEISGTIAGQGSTWLSVEFPIKSLTGEGTIDFSETALEISLLFQRIPPSTESILDSRRVVKVSSCPSPDTASKKAGGSRKGSIYEEPARIPARSFGGVPGMLPRTSSGIAKPFRSWV